MAQLTLHINKDNVSYPFQRLLSRRARTLGEKKWRQLKEIQIAGRCDLACRHNDIEWVLTLLVRWVGMCCLVGT